MGSASRSSKRSSSRRTRGTTAKAVIQLTPQQLAFSRANTPLVGYVGGRGAGKTYAGAYRVLRRAEPEKTYLVVAPTYTMLRDFAWPCLIDLARRTRCLLDIHLSRLAVSLVNRAMIIFRTADDPDRLRGLTVAGAWLDEAALMPREVYEVVLFTLRQTPGAWLAATFTPQGQRHWTFDRFGRQADDCTLIHAPTRSNPFLPDDFLRLVEREAAGRLAEQELEGRFVCMEGAEWPAEFWGDWVWVREEDMPRPADFDARALAVDPSLGKRDREGDYSAIVFLGIARGLLWVAADLARRPPYRIVGDTLDACQRFAPHVVGIEANQFQELLVHEFERQSQGRFGIAWPTFAIQNRAPKPLRIRRLGQYIVNRELRVLDNLGGRLLVGQLQDFPHGDHDDGPDALEMAVRMILELSGGSYGDERDLVGGRAGRDGLDRS
jgi:phage terminase large subunit-like protein